MTYQTTITKKGQIVIPKEIRDKINIKAPQKLIIEFDEKQKKIEIRPGKSIFELAGKIKPKKVVSAVKLREIMEKKYEGRF